MEFPPNWVFKASDIDKYRAGSAFLREFDKGPFRVGLADPHAVFQLLFGRVMKTFCLVMLAVASCLHAASSQFLLGVDYSEWAPANVAQVATDNSGNIYVLTKQSVVAKLTPDGGTLDWQTALGYSADQMAVDASGSVYILAFQAVQPALRPEKHPSGGPRDRWHAPVTATAHEQDCNRLLPQSAQLRHGLRPSARVS